MDKIVEMIMEWLMYKAFSKATFSVSEAKRRSRERSAQNWPILQGAYFSSDIKDLGKVKLFELTMVYRYHQGEYQSGTFKSLYKSERFADYVVKQSKTAPLKVHYHPNVADRSRLFREDLPNEREWQEYEQREQELFEQERASSESWRDSWYQ
jgi:hypothetical protein